MNARRLLRLSLLAALVTLAGSPGPARADDDAVPGELIVKYRAGVARAHRSSIEAALPAVTHVRAFDFIGAEQLRLSGLTTGEAIARLQADPEIEYAVPNRYVYAQTVPNDPSFSQLWGLQNTGQGGGYAGDDIKATQAWDLFTGDPNLKIGVIDTGIDYTHPDLAANIWTNPGEIPGNGIDDDHNGYVDDVHGYNFVANTGDPMDDSFHGTHVAGTIGAVGNNGVGIAGVNWRCKMVAIKFMNASGVGTEADAIAAIQYSLIVGCRVTNNSWGNLGGDQAMLDAINAAGAAGQLMVFAAGNNGWNIDLVPFYPPSYVAPNMITVTSTDGRDQRPLLTNFGAATVNLGAPGYNIYSCKPGGTYQSLNGTSMAAPHVTGTVALAMGRHPEATSEQLRRLILTSTDPIASMNGVTSSGGRLNAYKVLVNSDALAPSRVTDLAIADTGSTALGLRWTAPRGNWMSSSVASYELRMSTSPIDSVNFAGAALVPTPAPSPNPQLESLEVTPLAFNTHVYFALRATDAWGYRGPISNVPSVTTLGVPAVAFDHDSLALTLQPGTTRDTAVLVTNAGAGRLDFTVGAPSAPWLSAAGGAGRVLAPNSARLALHVDANALPEGGYGATLPITSNDPVSPSKSVAVHLTVTTATAVGDPPRAGFGLRLLSRNPSPGRVALALSLPAGGPAEVAIFDVRGRRIARLASGVLDAGVHTLRWDGTDEGGGRVAPGLYFARARTPSANALARIILLD